MCLLWVIWCMLTRAGSFQYRVCLWCVEICQTHRATVDFKSGLWTHFPFFFFVLFLSYPFFFSLPVTLSRRYLKALGQVHVSQGSEKSQFWKTGKQTLHKGHRHLNVGKYLAAGSKIFVRLKLADCPNLDSGGMRYM